MTSGGRRIAIILVVSAVVLSAGRWGSLFLTERLWESTVSESVAIAGARRALLGLSLELLVLMITCTWFVLHLVIAGRAALPDRPPPERPDARVWPARLPRWSLTAAGILLGIVLGSGAGTWLDQLLLTFDGVRFGVTDPLLGMDLGFYLRDFPLWLALQRLLTTITVAGLVAVLLIHAVGGAVGVTRRRVFVSPKVRGHLAVLLAALAVALAWGSTIEPFRLAAGLEGPMRSSEFLLRTLVTRIQAALGVGAAVASVLWWVRVRAVAAVIIWLLLGAAFIAGTVLPIGTSAAGKDEDWRVAARRLDSVAYALGAPEGPPLGLRLPGAALTPTLWDEDVLPKAMVPDSGLITPLSRGWIVSGTTPRPVWFALRESPDRLPVLLALADDRVSPSGGVLAWRETDSAPSPGAVAYRDLVAHGVRPTAPRFDLSRQTPGVTLDAWTKRVVLAWALQVPGALSAPAESRLGWRLDPNARLQAVAPFAHWSRARPRVTAGGVVWTSDGLLSSSLFPSSTRVEWYGSQISMLRPAFLGLVDGTTGKVRIFRKDPADSLAVAWARVTDPLIEAPQTIPAELRTGDPYAEELVLAQAQVAEGPAWRAGTLERPDGRIGIPPSAAGGGEFTVPLVRESTHQVTAFLLARRTVATDSVRLMRIDTTAAIDGPYALANRWAPFPFRQALDDSIHAVGGHLQSGRVRQAVAHDGVVGYQPVWAISAAGRAQLVIVNVMLGRSPGTGRSFADAWKNLRGESGPVAGGSGAEAVLEQARRWMLHADSALRRGDLNELQRALDNLRDLLGPPRTR